MARRANQSNEKGEGKRGSLITIQSEEREDKRGSLVTIQNEKKGEGGKGSLGNNTKGSAEPKAQHPFFQILYRRILLYSHDLL